MIPTLQARVDWMTAVQPPGAVCSRETSDSEVRAEGCEASHA